MKLKMFAGANKLLFERAARLRKQQTFAEEVLWNYLKTKPKSFKFRRQHVFGNYILDFYCHALRFAIEIDGTIHNNEEVKRNDLQRQEVLEQNGLTVIRFNNKSVLERKEKVINIIETLLAEKTKPE